MATCGVSACDALTKLKPGSDSNRLESPGIYYGLASWTFLEGLEDLAGLWLSIPPDCLIQSLSKAFLWLNTHSHKFKPSLILVGCWILCKIQWHGPKTVPATDSFFSGHWSLVSMFRFHILNIPSLQRSWTGVKNGRNVLTQESVIWFKARILLYMAKCF